MTSALEASCSPRKGFSAEATTRVLFLQDPVGLSTGSRAGLGRTGKMFGFKHSNLDPDIPHSSLKAFGGSRAGLGEDEHLSARYTSGALHSARHAFSICDLRFRFK